MQRWVNEADWQDLECSTMFADNVRSDHLSPPDDRRYL